MSITHYCRSGETVELEKGRYLPDADEYRSECDQCGAVYADSNGVEHQ